MRNKHTLSLVAKISMLGVGVTFLCQCGHAQAVEQQPQIEAATQEARVLLTYPTVLTPHSREQARIALERGFAAFEAQDYHLAAPQFRSVLRTDYLTDGGRKNIYWFTAEAYRRLGDGPAERDALESFLLTAELADMDPETEQRALHARTAIAAMKVAQNPGFGRSPENAIVVESMNEASSIISFLGCGPGGEGRFVEAGGQAYSADHTELLVRTAACTGSAQTIDLWFDVTYAQR